MSKISLNAILIACFLGLVSIGLASAYRQCGTQYCAGGKIVAKDKL